MTRDASGIWSVTSAPLEPTIHLYFFTIDGLAIADPINPKIKLRTRTSGSLVEVPGDPVPVWQMRDVPHGSVDWNVQHSAAYGDTHEFLVCLPPGYFKSSARYPVLVHGAGDTALSWTTAGNARLILDNLSAEKKATPMIVVMPFNGSNAPAPAPRRPPARISRRGTRSSPPTPSPPIRRSTCSGSAAAPRTRSMPGRRRLTRS